MSSSEVCRGLGEAAWSWVLGCIRDDDGPWLPEVVPDGDLPVGPAQDRDSLYSGIAGLAPVLAEIRQVRALSDVEMGNAGVVLAAVWAGGEHARELAETGGEALLRVAEPTAGGLDWRLHPTYPKSSPNYSHGTAGVATTLAIAGLALGREDFVAAAKQGAQHAAGIAAFLLRMARVTDDGLGAPVVDRPDQWWAVPAQLRTSNAGRQVSSDQG